MVSGAVNAVLFDVDGTLVDSRAAIVETYRHAVGAEFGDRAEGVWASTDLEHILQIPAAQVFALLGGGDPARTARLTKMFRDRYAEIEPSIPWFPGAIEAVRTLRADGLATAIVTSKARSRLDAHLHTAGATALFDAAISGDEVADAKPHPAPVRSVLTALGVAGHRAVMVGDGANDVLAAQRAGTGSVGAAYGFHPQDCRAACPDHWIAHITELPTLIESRR